MAFTSNSPRPAVGRSIFEVDVQGWTSLVVAADLFAAKRAAVQDEPGASTEDVHVISITPVPAMDHIDCGAPRCGTCYNVALRRGGRGGSPSGRGARAAGSCARASKWSTSTTAPTRAAVRSSSCREPVRGLRLTAAGPSRVRAPASVRWGQHGNCGGVIHLFNEGRRMRDTPCECGCHARTLH